MDAARDIFRKGLLHGAHAGIFGVGRLNRFNLLSGHQGEDAQVTRGIFIGRIDPVLVKLVGRGAVFVEPHVAAFTLSKFGPIGLGDERSGDGKGLAAALAANEFGTGDDVAPLSLPPIWTFTPCSFHR